MPHKICIDPGHGGYDPGACANGMQEKDLNLTIALGLKTLLEHAGVPVVMTRESDVCPVNVDGLSGNERERADLQGRCDICNTNEADLFLSIHCNAGGGNGAEAYVWAGGNASVLAPELIQALTPLMGVHGEPIKDGGPNGSNLYVIKYTTPPAILLEVGFMDSSDAQKIRDSLGNFAGILAPALIRYCGGSVPADVPVPAVPDIIPQTSATVADVKAIADQLQAHTEQSHISREEFIAALEALKNGFDTQITSLEEKLKG